MNNIIQLLIFLIIPLTFYELAIFQIFGGYIYDFNESLLDYGIIRDSPVSVGDKYISIPSGYIGKNNLSLFSKYYYEETKFNRHKRIPMRYNRIIDDKIKQGNKKGG